MNGRPFLFLAAVLGGWTAVRVLALWPEATALLAPPAARAARLRRDHAVAFTAVSAKRLPAVRSTTAPARFAPVPDAPIPAPSSLPAPFDPRIAPAPLPDDPGAIGLPSSAAAPVRSRWSGSLWGIVRGGGRGSAVPSPLLGGSQAGMRIVYAATADRRLGLFGRYATPLGAGPAEAALGVQWRLPRLPVTAFAEARLLGRRLSPAFGGFGGGAMPLGRFRLDGYGQAGVIAGRSAIGFADGQLRLTRSIDRLELGIGLWGAVQPGAQRVDIGPTLGLPIAAKPLNLRVTLDWRQRVAGHARPASGPALSLGADF